jgi:hypothetical protein
LWSRFCCMVLNTVESLYGSINVFIFHAYEFSYMERYWHDQILSSGDEGTCFLSMLLFYIRNNWSFICFLALVCKIFGIVLIYIILSFFGYLWYQLVIFGNMGVLHRSHNECCFYLYIQWFFGYDGMKEISWFFSNTLWCLLMILVLKVSHLFSMWTRIQFSLINLCRIPGQVMVQDAEGVVDL